MDRSTFLASCGLAVGTLGILVEEPLGDRFIPACAGNASTVKEYLTARTVHPQLAEI
jgi:hypothetical protein